MANFDPTTRQPMCQHPTLMYRGLEYHVAKSNQEIWPQYHYFDTYYCIHCLAIVAVPRNAIPGDSDRGTTNNQGLLP